MIYVKIKWMLGLFVLINLRIAVVKSSNISKGKGKELWPFSTLKNENNAWKFFSQGILEKNGLPQIKDDEILDPETKKEQDLAHLQSMSRSLKPVKMPKAFELELYVYFGPSLIKFVSGEKKAESTANQIADVAKKWFADPSLGARIIVQPNITKVNNDTPFLSEWSEMVPKENHKLGRVHTLIVANMSVGSKPPIAFAYGMAKSNSVCGKRYSPVLNNGLKIFWVTQPNFP